MQELPRFIMPEPIYPSSLNQLPYPPIDPQMPPPPGFNWWENNHNLMMMNREIGTNNFNFSLNLNVNTSAPTNENKHRNSLSNLDSGSLLNPLLMDSYKNLEEEGNFNKHSFPTFGVNPINIPLTNPSISMIPHNRSDTQIRNSSTPVNFNSVQSSESLKEINLIQKLNTIQEEQRSVLEPPNINNISSNGSNDNYIKLKVVTIKQFNLKTKNPNLFHAIIDLSRKEIVLTKQCTPNLSPKSSGSRQSYLSALLSLNQSFGSLKMPSNDSIRSSDGNIKLGFQRVQKEGNLNSHFKDHKI